MIFNVLSVVAFAAVGSLADMLDVTYPHTGTVWTQAYDHNVTWVPGTGSGTIILGHSGQNTTLKSNVDLTSGRTEVTVPQLGQGSGYIIFIDGPNGQSGSSVQFAVGQPDVPGSPTGVTTTTTTSTSGSASATGSGVTTTTSTATAPGGSITSAASSASSAASSVASSASTAIDSLSSSLSSAEASLSSAAGSGASSISSALSSALSSATGSGSGSGASPSSTGSSAVGTFADFKLGAALTAGVLIVSTLGGLSIF